MSSSLRYGYLAPIVARRKLWIILKIEFNNTVSFFMQREWNFYGKIVGLVRNAQFFTPVPCLPRSAISSPSPTFAHLISVQKMHIHCHATDVARWWATLRLMFVFCGTNSRSNGPTFGWYWGMGNWRAYNFEDIWRRHTLDYHVRRAVY